MVSQPSSYKINNSSEGTAWRGGGKEAEQQQHSMSPTTSKKGVITTSSVPPVNAVTAAETRHTEDNIVARTVEEREDGVVIDLTERRRSTSTKWYDKFDWDSVKIDDQAKPLVTSNDVVETFAVVSAVPQPSEEFSTRQEPIVVDEEVSVRKPPVREEDQGFAARNPIVVVDEEMSARHQPHNNTPTTIVVDEEFSARTPKPIVVDEEVSTRKQRQSVFVFDDEFPDRSLREEGVRPDNIDSLSPIDRVTASRKALYDVPMDEIEQDMAQDVNVRSQRKKSRQSKIEVETVTDEEESVLASPSPPQSEQPPGDASLFSNFLCDMFACMDPSSLLDPLGVTEPVAPASSTTTTMKAKELIAPHETSGSPPGTKSVAGSPPAIITPTAVSRPLEPKSVPSSPVSTESEAKQPAARSPTTASPSDAQPRQQNHQREDPKPRSKLTIDTKVDPAGDSPKGEPPKPEQLKHSPATHTEGEMIYRQDTDDTEGLSEEEILESCQHLQTVPSLKEDVEDSVAPMKPTDLGKSSPRGSAAFVEKKAQELCDDVSLNSKLSKSSTASKASDNPEVVEEKPPPTSEARRVTLAKELRNSITAFGRYDLRTANISASLADVMLELGNYEKATQLHRDAVSIYSCKLGDDHSTTLEAKIRLGQALEKTNDVEEAINMYYQVTVMRRAVRGDRDPSVADGLVCMSNALRRKEDYVQAIKELKRALKIFRESLGDSDKKVSATVDEIASLYITIGDFKKAAAILEEVVKLKAATQGTKSKSVASTLLQLSTAHECADDHVNALRAMKKAYKIYSEVDGHNSEDATITLNRMAMLYEATKDFNRAAVAYLGVLRSRKTQFGPEHTSVGETYFHLGKALRETRQYEKALKCLKEALPIFVGQGVEIEDVKTVAEIMHEMALTNQDRGKLGDAIRIFKQELSVRRKVGQPEFPFAAKTLKHLGLAEYHMESYNRSLKHLIEALGLYQERGHEGVECAEVLLYSGLVFQKLKNPSRARKALTEAVRMLEDSEVDDDHELLVQAKQKLRSI